MVTIQLKFCKTETWYLMVSACPKASPPRNPLVFYFTLDFGRNTFHIKKKKKHQAIQETILTQMRRNPLVFYFTLDF